MARYIVRMFSDSDGTNATEPGTIVRPVDIQVSLYADSADEAENRLRLELAAGKLPKGHVYQICPLIASVEPIRTCAVAPDGSVERVLLDPIDGPYSEARRILAPGPAAEPSTVNTSL
jgi:hypothetical protein